MPRDLGVVLPLFGVPLDTVPLEVRVLPRWSCWRGGVAVEVVEKSEVTRWSCICSGGVRGVGGGVIEGVRVGGVPERTSLFSNGLSSHKGSMAGLASSFSCCPNPYAGGTIPLGMGGVASPLKPLVLGGVRSRGGIKGITGCCASGMASKLCLRSICGAVFRLAELGPLAGPGDTARC